MDRKQIPAGKMDLVSGKSENVSAGVQGFLVLAQVPLLSIIYNKQAS